jgi:hypothetical protein
MEELNPEEFLKLSEKPKAKRKRIRLASLDYLASRFDEAHKAFYKRKDKSFWYFHEGPCLFFHRRTIERYRELRREQNFSYQRLVSDTKYLEYLYATLTAWGLNRPGTTLKLVNFDKFAKVLQTSELTSLLDDIKDFKIENVSSDGLTSIQKKMNDIFGLFGEKTKITLAEDHLITTSKVLHHLHPDLLPPIDRRYTLWLLRGLEETHYRPLYSNDFNTWWRVFLCFHYVAIKKRDFSSYTERMDTSIPKIIDNALVGYGSLDNP